MNARRCRPTQAACRTAAALIASCTAWAAETPPASPPPAPAPPPAAASASRIDVTRVAVLGYHRFDNGRARDGLSIGVADFQRQMQTLRDRGLAVIPMSDFLEWAQGRKEIPERAVLITIDDGYSSVYEVGWPILKKFGYPFTLFVYVNYISGGGKALTWDQVGEMGKAGVEIGSHSISHTNLDRRGGLTSEQYLALIRRELGDSKRMIEERLGLKIRTFAYPYGIFSPETVRVGIEDVGYEALFTVQGAKVARPVDRGRVGRYVVLSDRPDIFESAIAFGGPSATGIPGLTLPVRPGHGELIGEDRPLLSVDLSAVEGLDPASLEMTLTGLGLLPATFDPATKTLSYQVRRILRAARYTVGLKIAAAGRTIRTSWEFGVDERQRLSRFLPEQYPVGD